MKLVLFIMSFLYVSAIAGSLNFNVNFETSSSFSTQSSAQNSSSSKDGIPSEEEEESSKDSFEKGDELLSSIYFSFSRTLKKPDFIYNGLVAQDFISRLFTPPKA